MNILSVSRVYQLYYSFESSSVTVDVSFSRSNNGINLVVSNKSEVEVEFESKLYLNPAKSPFVEANLNLSNITKNKLRVSNQFDNTRNKSCQMITNESLILSKVNVGGRDFYQKVQLYSFLNNDTLYIHAERHFIDVIAEEKIVTSAGLEISKVVKGV